MSDVYDLINKIIDEVPEKGLISDGSHTFSELYYDRCMLFSIVCHLLNRDECFEGKVWKSLLHYDGSMYPEHFIVGITNPEGRSFSYHYQLDYWDLFKVPEVSKSPKWVRNRDLNIDDIQSELT